MFTGRTREVMGNGDQNRPVVGLDQDILSCYGNFMRDCTRLAKNVK